jgi:Fe-S-cluster-containing hydrogenase component 2
MGVHIDTYNIEKLVSKGEKIVLSGYDSIGIGYPVYAFNTPKTVWDLVKSLPMGEGRKVFIFKTAGEPFYWNDSSSLMIIKRLQKKGYRVVFERHYLMPYNIIMRYPDSLVKQMYNTTQKLCIDMAERIMNGEEHLPKFTFKSRLAAFVFRIQWPGAAINGRLCSTNKRCNLCMKCANSCPTHNILLKSGKICFSWKCVMCMRCVMYCPKDAINFGLLKGLALNGAYDFNKIISDDAIPDEYVNDKTRGFFKFFKKYYLWAERTCKEDKSQS